eukprot:191901-Pelagomonas_calceolata.AAC.2
MLSALCKQLKLISPHNFFQHLLKPVPQFLYPVCPEKPVMGPALRQPQIKLSCKPMHIEPLLESPRLKALGVAKEYICMKVRQCALLHDILSDAEYIMKSLELDVYPLERNCMRRSSLPIRRRCVKDSETTLFPSALPLEVELFEAKWKC